mgnify:CR=1 FL=1
MKCAAFWNHVNLRSGDQIYPCCRFKYPVGKFDGDLGSILHSKTYQDLRHNSSERKILGCGKCYKEEELGIESMRQRFNKQYSTDEVKLKFLEIGFDNICNLSCKCCSEEFSHTWAQENLNLDKKNSIIVSTQEIKNIPQTINRILFLGGEPLMTNRHLKFLRSLKYPELVSITYNTNGTFLLSDDGLNLLKKFKNVNFIISIDAYGTDNEKVRPNSSWQKILNFINQITEHNFNFSIHTVLYTENYDLLPNLSSWIHKNRYQWTLNILTYPIHLSINTLDEEQKNKLLSSLKNNKIPNRKYIENYLNEN